MRAATVVSAGSGQWNSTIPDAPWPGGILPGDNDDVVIRPGDLVTVTANATISSISFTNTSSEPATLAVNAGATLTVSGAITLQNGKLIVTAAGLTGQGAVQCASLQVGGTVEPLGTPKACTLTSSINWLGISGNVTNRSQGPGGGKANNASFVIDSGSVGVGGIIELNADGGSTASLTLASGAQTGTLVLSNATPFTLVGAGTKTFSADGTAATVIYSGGAQTVHPVVYHHLVMAGSGTKTLAGFSTVAGDLVVSGNAVAALGSALTIEGNLEVDAGATLRTTTYNFSVEGTTSLRGTLEHTSTSGNKDFGNDVTIHPGGLWTNGVNETITFDGGLENNGSLVAGTGVQTFRGSGSLEGSSGITLAQAAINGAYTNKGSFNLTASLAGAGTLTQGAEASLNLGGLTTISNLVATGAVNTVTYSGGAQAIMPAGYHHLTLSGIGSKGITNVTSIAGDLAVSGAAVMTGNSSFTVGGRFSYASTETTVLTSETPIAIGQFTQTSGVLDVGGSTITATGSGPATWVQTGGVFTGSGTVEFAGVAPEIDAFAFHNLAVNLGNGNAATLSGSISVGGTLTLTSGRLFTGTNVLSVAETAAVAGAGSSAYVAGNFRKHFAPGTGLAFVFPVGDALNYTPVELTNLDVTGGGHLTSGSSFATDHAQIPASGLDATRSVNRYWTLLAGGGLTIANCDAAFEFVAADVDSGAAFQGFIVRRYDPTAGAWSAHTDGTRASGRTEVIGLSEFGEFAIGEQGLDHYQISASSPQKVEAPFLATITAQDVINETVPGAATVVTLSSSGSVQFDSDADGVFGDDSKQLSGGMAVISAKGLAAGTLSISVSDANGKTGTSSLITIDRGDQFITFNSPGDQTFGVSPIKLTATSSSGLAVTYEVSSGPATVEGNTLTIAGAGSVTVQANQAGNANWNPATPVSVTFQVGRATTSLQVVSSANPALPGTAVTFTVTLNVPGPAGAVTFRDGTASLGTGTLDASGVAGLDTSSLSHGNHAITAEYLGDSNFFGSTNSLAGVQLINTPPVAADISTERHATGSVKLNRASLMDGSSDADSDALSLSISSTSAKGGTVVVNGNWLIFTPAPGCTEADSFIYTVTDDYGASATGTVDVGIKTAGSTQNLRLSDQGGGSFLVEGDGIPGRTYRLQYTDSLSPPDWQDLPGATDTADSLGQYRFTDTPGAPMRAYRSVSP